METRVHLQQKNGDRALETFLVEWKHGQRVAIFRMFSNLETFLVEWKLLEACPDETGPRSLKPS